MKKLCFTVLIIVVILCPVFAMQRNYRSSSEEYKTLETLASLSGTTLENVVTPVSAEEMLNMLSHIDRASLSAFGQNLYDSLYNKLENPKTLFENNGFGFFLNAKAGSDFYTHSNSSVNNSIHTISYKDKPSLAEADLDVYLTDNVYAKINLALRKSMDGSRKIGSNTFVDFILDTGSYSQVVPSYAYVSVGTENLNLSIGRDRLASGKGFSGNLLLDENQDYNDFLKFSFYKNKVSYDFSLIAYAGYKYDQVNDVDFIALYDKDPTPYENELYWPNFTSPTKTMLLHRATFTFKNVNFAFYEGSVFYRTFGTNLIQTLNPMLVIHNTGSYYSGNTNNFFGVELSSNFGKGLSFDAQFIADQIQLKSETHENPAPNAMGIMASLAKTFEYKNGVVKAWAEGVYNTEGLYLKEKQNNYPMYKKAGKPMYFYYLEDMISGNLAYSDPEEFTYMGYKLGGDIKVLSVGAEYTTEKYNIEAVLTIADKGYYGIGKNETRYLTEKANGRLNEKTVVLNVNGQIKLLDGISVFGSLSALHAKNFEHTSKTENDVQLFVGCQVQLDGLIY